MKHALFQTRCRCTLWLLPGACCCSCCLPVQLCGRGDGRSAPKSSSKANVRERHLCFCICTFRLDLFFFFFFFSAAVVEDHNSENDYEKVDDEKMEGARCVNPETDDEDYEGSLPREPSVRMSSEDEDEEADYINLTSGENVQVVDVTGDGESDYENVTSAKEEQLIYILAAYTYMAKPTLFIKIWLQSDLRRQNTRPSSDGHLDI